MGTAVGIYLHMGWARRLAMALAIVGLAVGAVFFVGPLATFQVPLLDPLMITTLIAMAGYAFSLLAMLVGGSHFRPNAA